MSLSVQPHGPLLVVHKPAGLPCFPPHADPAGDCVLARLHAAGWVDPETAFPAGFAGGIAHRLDISTSGQLLVARSPAALAQLRTAFTEKRLTKHYLLWTRRRPRWEAHRCLAPIAHDRKKKRRMVVQRGSTTPHRGRWLAAETRFRVVGAAEGGWLLEARMRTGVMHQIRVHAGFLGVALAGDRLYGGGPLDRDHGPGTDFLLHHLGLEGPGLQPPRIAAPADWPQRDRAGAPGW